MTWPYTLRGSVSKYRRHGKASRGGLPPGTVTLFVDKTGHVATRRADMGLTYTDSVQFAADTLYHGGCVRFPNSKPAVDLVRTKLGECSHRHSLQAQEPEFSS